jgi:hypothetical protein
MLDSSSSPAPALFRNAFSRWGWTAHGINNAGIADMAEPAVGLIPAENGAKRIRHFLT